MITGGPNVTQPKLKSETRAVLFHHGMSAMCYQPVALFRPGKRKLPNVAEPDDPWECFLRRPGEFGVVARGIGDTPDEAVANALDVQPFGLMPAIQRLGNALSALTVVYRHAC